MSALPQPAARPQLDLRDCIQVFDQALSPGLCARMIQSFQQLQRFQRGNGRGVRTGLEHSAWTELDITPLSDAGFRASMRGLMQTYLDRYNQRLALTLPVPPARDISELVIKRYRAGHDEQFQPHFDSIGEVANRYLVFLWYLNDVEHGGETAFVDLDIEVQPRAGRLLMFPPQWMYQHVGRPPLSGDKYILSTYFLF